MVDGLMAEITTRKGERVMTALRRKMTEDLQLAGYSIKTMESYLYSVQGLAKHYRRSPDLLTEEEVRQFFIHLINERKLSGSSITIYLCGIKFFFETTLKRKLNILDIVRPQRAKRLPVILSQEEVRTILKRVKRPIYRMALTIIYACGLRISEGVRLKTTDIDGKRHLLRVRYGKGGKDRYVPLHERPPGAVAGLLPQVWERFRVSLSPQRQPHTGRHPASSLSEGGEGKHGQQAGHGSHPASLIRHPPLGEW
jgi:integrase/recombinase XerD